ncbi:GNAT family N-acetyltransferase [Fodinicurvata sp. EGI_FJ10296]|uniref:GNAT family N-acetyltransferase n=1 Tax=Fodinicurvata sp. EGI_FJ10296 TaxID=3231908 RepID=UPI00345565CA
MTVEMDIQPYNAATDLPGCMAIWRAASEDGHPFLTTRDLDADERKVRDVYMPMAQTRVAVVDGTVAGFIALLDDFIGGLFVDPARFRKGIGRRLIEDAIRRKGRLSLEVYERNERALAFYRSLGFRATGRRPTDDQDRPLALVSLVLDDSGSALTSAADNGRPAP